MFSSFDDKDRVSNSMEDSSVYSESYLNNQADEEDSFPLQLRKCENDREYSLSMQDLPEEILEIILSFLSPYKDMDLARLVSKQWYCLISSIVRHRRRQFYTNLNSCNIRWIEVVKDVGKVSERNPCSHITDRFSHSAAFLNGSMYIFGGCTSTNTTFNDLWIFDLTTRVWIRPVAMGAYPSPKACATMVVYNGNLVLYGGWSHPIPYPLHQSAHYFSELHVYNPVSNRWSHIHSLGQEPEALGGHSASVVGHLMVVFGGSPRPGQGTNNIWVFNFLKASWKLQPVSRQARPEPRYGQFQTTIDEKHVLIMGGCVGPHKPFNDVWLLTLHEDKPWQWTQIEILNPDLAAPQTWCHAACRVKDTIVVISKSSKLRQAKNGLPRIHVSSLLKHGHSREPSTTMDDSMNDSQLSSSNTGQLTVDPNIPNTTQCTNSRGNLLALQQKLHREYESLSDPDDHHHNSLRHQQYEPEGHFLRLENRWVHQRNVPQNEASRAPQNIRLQLSVDLSNPSQFQDRQQQPHRQPEPRGINSPRVEYSHRGNPMPSIRPNATSNRQRQLEALQRQEEILRSKSNALATARKQMAAGTSQSVDGEEVPEIISVKNRMDVYTLDISRVLCDGVAEWRPLSELQASCSPTETICCSLLEGRGELILFGGVIRESASKVSVNTAVNKLYLLHA